MSTDTAITSLKEKIDDLNQQAWEGRVTDLPKAFELSQESVKLARSINYPRGLAEGLRSLGFSYVRFFKNDEAAPLLKESLSLFQSLNDLKGQAVIYEYLGIIERNWGNLGASLDLLLKAYELVLQNGPPEVEITCSYQLGVTYKHLGNHENALDYLYKTLSLAKKINIPLMEAYATNIIGSIYFDNGNYNQALDCYQQGLIIRQQSHDKWGEAGSLDNIGFTYLKLNDFDKAIEYCKQSLTICKATDDKKGEANALLHLGEIYEQAGDIKQAADFSNESLEIRKARGDKRGETEVLLFLADLYKKRNDVEDHQIFEWLSNALKIADEIKAQDLLSKAYYNLHEYYQQKGNFKESLVQLEAHFQIEKELHKNSINQKIANLEISHKAEVVSQRNKELTELNERIEKANEELKIEASLERVRSRTNAMHRSENLHEVINEVNDQLRQLGFQFDGTDFMTDFSDRGYNIWLASFPTPIYVPAIDHKLVHLLKEVKKRGDNFFTFTLTTEEKNQYFKNVFQNTIAKNFPEELKQYVYNAKGMATSCVVLKNIILSVTNFAAIPYTVRENEILKRFAFVFEQSYTRFLDLQKAEAQARESQIEAALERVRSRTMGMQKSEELKDVIQVVYEQFVQLNIHIEHTGFVMDYKARDDYDIWIADKLGVPSHVTIPYFDSVYYNRFNEAKQKGESFFAAKLTFDEKNKFYQKIIEHVPGLPEETKQFLFSVPGLAISTVLLENVCLYIENFAGTPYSDEENATLMRFGKVFQQTYTRFNDLKLAEAHALQAEEDLVKLQTEKKRAEDALSELQVTQKQLIQSEKMASLGELTAGIAHEIQNPLNFVNNFSDVNKELLVEMKEEIEKGNTEEVIAIANDIISNEEKINHHGKRADAIVKGMLQHSRRSSGVKEPTDINELADEFLRLAYHGLRAKDKSFNATMKTDFDEAIGKVNVIPQDIGRVFLNLITNAFYVVSEKKKQLANGYEPTVTVTTKKESDKVIVSVKDNGSGIPHKVLDKIFQPFFTTKPTGQGTGLGLSLSYDIVKAHSGEIKVKTKDGEGSEFVIQLPIDQ